MTIYKKILYLLNKGGHAPPFATRSESAWLPSTSLRTGIPRGRPLRALRISRDFLRRSKIFFTENDFQVFSTESIFFPATFRWYHSFWLYFAFVFMFCTLNLLAEPSINVPELPDVDNGIFRIGLFRGAEISSVRITAIRGNWTVTLSHFPTGNIDESLFSQETKLSILEGEGLTFDGASKGFWGKTSDGRELREGYIKAKFSGGNLLDIEIPGQPHRVLPGLLEVNKSESFLSFFNDVSLRTFLISSVSEGCPSSEFEAIKSQVVVSRTFALFAKESGRHASESFDLCDKEHCLGYSGYVICRELVELMVDEVKNRTITYHGKLFLPFFQNTCGGKISSPKDILGIENQAHGGMEDRIGPKGLENCFHSPFFKWRLEFTPENIIEFLEFSYSYGAVGVYLKWDPIKLDPNGRITLVKLSGKRQRVVSGLDFFTRLGEFFGKNAIKSLKFNVKPMRQTVVYHGNGAGLGMGMCQMGADGLAKKGFEYWGILSFYYAAMDGAKKIEIKPRQYLGKNPKEDINFDTIKNEVEAVIAPQDKPNKPKYIRRD